MLSCLQQEAADDADEPHDRADRQIDATGENDRGHAERHDADEGEVARDVEEIIGRGEGVGLIERHHGDDGEHRDRHPEGLAREHLLAEAALAQVRHLLDRGMACR